MNDSTLRPDLPGDVVAPAAQAEWVEKAKRFLKRARADDEVEVKKKKVKQARRSNRMAAYRHTLCLDAQLRCVVDDGLSSFVPKEGDDDKLLVDLPTLVTNEDSGQVPFCSKDFRCFQMGQREVPYRDVFHMFWRAILNSVKDAGLRGVLLLVGICHNLAYGPWQGCAWFEQICEGALDYFETAGPSCPLFRRLLPRILKERGRGDEVLTEAEIREVWESMKDEDFLRAKGPRMQISRWISWMQCEEWWKGLP